jgi:hypothetical protein
VEEILTFGIKSIVEAICRISFSVVYMRSRHRSQEEVCYTLRLCPCPRVCTYCFVRRSGEQTIYYWSIKNGSKERTAVDRGNICEISDDGRLHK